MNLKNKTKDSTMSIIDRLSLTNRTAFGRWYELIANSSELEFSLTFCIGVVKFLRYFIGFGSPVLNTSSYEYTLTIPLFWLKQIPWNINNKRFSYPVIKYCWFDETHILVVE
jgi:hypothetical protein